MIIISSDIYIQFGLANVSLWCTIQEQPHRERPVSLQRRANPGAELESPRATTGLRGGARVWGGDQKVQERPQQETDIETELGPEKGILHPS